MKTFILLLKNAKKLSRLKIKKILQLMFISLLNILNHIYEITYSSIPNKHFLNNNLVYHFLFNLKFFETHPSSKLSTMFSFFLKK